MANRLVRASGLPAPASGETADYLAALKDAGFAGDVETDPAHRLANATDNSIYQIVASAVLSPQHAGDLVRLVEVANRRPFRDLTFFPRGGGTSTNGQSLGPGIVVDT